MRIFDISTPIRSGMEVYPGDPEVTLERVNDYPAISRLDFGVHTATHVDAPSHFVEGGAPTEEMSLDVLVGPCEVVIGRGVAERVLIKDGELLDEAGARELVDGGTRLVGVNRLSVGDRDAHKVLLEAGIVIVEGLDLSDVEPGTYELYCLPLLLVGSDGAPARAILVRR